MQKPLLAAKFSDWWLIAFFALTKLIIHLLTYDNYELHRDAYLYYAQSQHLAWGYISAPPSVAVFVKIATALFGNTTFAMRFFPAVIGAINFIVIGLMIRELGGGKISLILASLAFLLSPAYLHVHTLLQPVCFNQLYWLISGYLILLMVSRANPKIWIWIAVIFGLAFLNKYSIVFLFGAFAFALLLSRHRSLYLSNFFVISVFIGLLIILPNLIWQYQHNWPVVTHMSELKRTQLVHVRVSDFILDQFLMNAPGMLIWLTGLFTVLFVQKERKYGLFGWMFLFLIVLLLLGSGKSYYTLGIYPIMFVFGAYFIEKYSGRLLPWTTVFLISSILAVWYISLSFDGIPFYGFERVAKKGGFRWEDGRYYDVPQDMADMRGWNAIGKSVADIYSNLTEAEKRKCDIYCYHYGQAGAVMFHGKCAGVPQPISYNGSFILWSPDSLTGDQVIWVHSDLGSNVKPDSLLPHLFGEVEIKFVINDPYFREDGTRIYLCRFPKDSTRISYVQKMAEYKKRYNRQ